MRCGACGGTDFKRWEKAPGNPVCEVDLAVDAMLRERLTALLPDAGWLSEETADDAVAARPAPRLGGRPDRRHARLCPRPRGLGVSVALVDGEQPVIGVLDAPARGEVWRAEAGQGRDAQRRADRA